QIGSWQVGKHGEGITHRIWPGGRFDRDINWSRGSVTVGCPLNVLYDSGKCVTSDGGIIPGRIESRTAARNDSEARSVGEELHLALSQVKLDPLAKNSTWLRAAPPEVLAVA